MTERAILFSGAMPAAIRSGRKTQTRRIVKARYPLQFLGGRGCEDDPSAWGWAFDGPDHHGYNVLARGYDDRFDGGQVSIPCPYGAPGDRLRLLSTWSTHARFDALKPLSLDADVAVWSHFSAEEKPITHGKNRPGRFMPTYLRKNMPTALVSDVRVQRLHDISEADALAEGIRWFAMTAAGVTTRLYGVDQNGELGNTARDGYAILWESINGAGSWEANPWVWAITFAAVLP